MSVWLGAQREGARPAGARQGAQSGETGVSLGPGHRARIRVLRAPGHEQGRAQGLGAAEGPLQALSPHLPCWPGTRCWRQQQGAQGWEEGMFRSPLTSRASGGPRPRGVTLT